MLRNQTNYSAESRRYSSLKFLSERDEHSKPSIRCQQTVMLIAMRDSEPSDSCDADLEFVHDAEAIALKP